MCHKIPPKITGPIIRQMQYQSYMHVSISTWQKCITISKCYISVVQIQVRVFFMLHFDLYRTFLGGFLWSTWWRHHREIFSALLTLCEGNSPITGEFRSQRPVTGLFDVFFDLRLNKRLSKQSTRQLFETLSRPLWHHCNVCAYILHVFSLTLGHCEVICG